MALTPRSGFSNLTSGRNDVPNEIPNTQSDVLNNMPFITDTNLNKLAIDPKAYPNTNKMLVGFIQGKRINVTYYRLMRQGGINMRSNIADSPTHRNVLNTEYQKILNLEITLPKGFEFTADPERADIDVHGEAMFYPNMNPNVADQFTCGIGDGRIGIFQVTRVSAASWRSDRIYLVNFSLQGFLDDETSAPLEAAVTLTSVFSKENYLGGTAALLSETTYLHIQTLRARRSSLSKLYYQLFFDKELCSYVRPDGIYDPSAVQFAANKISMDDVHYRPKVLTGSDPKIYKQTIWARLEDRHNTNLYGLASQAVLKGYTQTRMGVFVTELHGRSIMTPEKNLTDREPYVFSGAFYAGTIADMTDFEKVIYAAVTTRKVGDLGVLLTEYIDTVYTLPEDDLYYRIPLYIHLIDMAFQSEFREIDAPSMNYASTGG